MQNWKNNLYFGDVGARAGDDGGAAKKHTVRVKDGKAEKTGAKKGLEKVLDGEPDKPHLGFATDF